MDSAATFYLRGVWEPCVMVELAAKDSANSNQANCICAKCTVVKVIYSQ